jgi:hypothetical protein
MEGVAREQSRRSVQVTVLKVKRFAAHDLRTGKQVGEPRFSERTAEQDARKLTKKLKTECVAQPVAGT